VISAPPPSPPQTPVSKVKAHECHTAPPSYNKHTASCRLSLTISHLSPEMSLSQQPTEKQGWKEQEESVCSVGVTLHISPMTYLDECSMSMCFSDGHQPPQTAVRTSPREGQNGTFTAAAGWLGQYSDQVTGRMTGVRFPVGTGIFFSSPPRPERLWGPASYAMSTVGSFPRGKAAEA
jgi:hypothetical protein